MKKSDLEELLEWYHANYKSATIEYLERYYTPEALSHITPKDEIGMIADIYERKN